MTKKRKMPFTQEYLKECFDYNPDTGELTWRERPLHHFATQAACNCFRTKYAGQVAGHNKVYTDFKTYNEICFYGGVNWFSHRLIWKLVTGDEPGSGLDIDHINGDTLDNRWENLRLTKYNMRNKRKAKNNTSGYAGVSYRSDSGRYRARLAIDNPDGTTRRIILGNYDTAEEANEALVEYRKKHGYTDRHGT